MTAEPTRTRRPLGQTVHRKLAQSWQALREWNRRQWAFTAASTVVFGLLLGVATVLIPNPVFGRDIAPVWWNYPVWILTSIGMGLLIGSYVNPQPTNRKNEVEDAQSQANLDTAIDGSLNVSQVSLGIDEENTKTTLSEKLGIAGGALAWFAVGCPVCNKIALLALGYSGAITWFAPVQPFLAVLALALTVVAVVYRLSGQIECPLPQSKSGASGSQAVNTRSSIASNSANAARTSPFPFGME